MIGRRVALFLVAVLVTGCGAPVLANPPAQPPVIVPAPRATPPRVADPVPVVLPRDDGPHQRLTEWWYYTGHLVDGQGGRWGFEFVMFRGERGGLPVSWASHVALTDETGGRFLYAQRAQIGQGVDESPATPQASPRFSFAIAGTAPTSPPSAGRTPWRMAGGSGRDRLQVGAALDEVTATAGAADGFSLDLRLESLVPPALHDADGWVDFGAAGGSYYYSRTRQAAVGRLDVGGQSLAVQGTAWFDHQWGDFIAVGGGGWDWFAINLADGTDLTLSLVRDRDGGYPLVYGTFVERDGRARHLERSDFSVGVIAHWQSPRTGTDYPAGWHISIPARGLEIDLRPTVASQELDTRATTGVVYWEGSQRVTARVNGRPLGGDAYVELTGYGRTSTTNGPAPAP